ncbi:MAG: hypothetical protein DBX55_09270 [Verrucomicrobia bacterium]|nr:MAG: hypothetical protein DBX55_09270 [Verrucomicrobiota bacterium]
MRRRNIGSSKFPPQFFAEKFAGMQTAARRKLILQKPNNGVWKNIPLPQICNARIVKTAFANCGMRRKDFFAQSKAAKKIPMRRFARMRAISPFNVRFQRLFFMPVFNIRYAKIDACARRRPPALRDFTYLEKTASNPALFQARGQKFPRLRIRQPIRRNRFKYPKISNLLSRYPTIFYTGGFIFQAPAAFGKMRRTAM